MAHVALGAYGLSGARVRPLRGLELRGVFRVDAWERGVPARFVLRLHGPGEDTLKLRSVLDWLVALRRDTDLGVPEPVAARGGALLVEVPALPEIQGSSPPDGQPRTRYSELLRWLEGRVPGRAFSRGMMARLGAFTARLHRHAMGFVPPPGFSRPRGEADAILRGEASVVPQLGRWPGALAAGERRMLEEVEARLHEEERSLPRDRASFGLMHGDLHPRNLLFHQGDIRAIDFEGCAPDFFLYDLASSLVEGTAGWEILMPDAGTGRAALAPAFASGREALLRGYAAVRPLPSDATHLTTFVAVRALSSLPWLAEWATGRVDDGWTRLVLAARVRFLRAYLGGFRLEGAPLG
jgi:Ser/Thr protein kinase RdoA (MazF antagonist)